MGIEASSIDQHFQNFTSDDGVGFLYAVAVAEGWAGVLGVWGRLRP